MNFFINLSNHPSDKWSDEQLVAGKEYGEIIDIQFPAIDPNISNQEMNILVDEYYNLIQEYDHPVVMIQGEFVFTYRMVNKLKRNGIKAVTSCTARIVTEKFQADGTLEKTSLFRFVCFREY